MKILIIGGTGLISTPLTRFLLERGDDVTLYNRGQTPSRLPPGATALHGDRQQYAQFEAEMHAAGRFDCVIDMVGYAPEDAHSVVRAFAGRIGQFIFCSTVDVYQKPASRYPYVEGEPYGGLNDYGRNKVLCEKTLLDAHARGAFPVTIIRPAYTYGETRGAIYPLGSWDTYKHSLLAGRPIISHGDGSSLWVSCHVDDVARAFVGAVHNPKAFGQCYHTTGEEWLTWDQYHAVIAQALGAPPPVIVHIPTDTLVKLAPRRSVHVADNFQFNNVFDNSAARADLGFAYTVPLVDGMRRAFAWLDHNRPASGNGADEEHDRILAAWRELEGSAVSAL
ncbi:MAG: NAD-dependent epimerase/dehydratase family protein [Anaerolineae bacterium]|nr:NAD-dependent epimerase/dehydratase family protein [Anaerolineae bacterium]